MIVEGEVKAQHLSEDHARGIAALPRATKDYERNPTTEASDPYRLVDIATRAIQLMFPGTAEDDIELPAFAYPHVPSARAIVRQHIEMITSTTGAAAGLCPGGASGVTGATSGSVLGGC